MSPAFDDRRPPDPGIIEDCVHCGFCLPACPTYLLWNEEMDSPRGRIVLMQLGREEGSEMSDALVTHLDRCLGCMACVSACPSGVRYDRLIEAARPQVERNARRPGAERLRRTALFALLTHPGRLRAGVPLLAAAQRAGLPRSAGGTLTRLLRLAPRVEIRDAAARLPEVTPARGRRRGRVALLQGCVQRVLFHRVNEATVRVLSAEGFEVLAPRAPRCCGALLFHAGYEEEAAALARQAIAALWGCDAVVTNAAGCGSAMKEYGWLLGDGGPWAERARRFSATVRDVTEFLAEAGTVAPRHPVPMTVAYHDACHLAHAQGVRAQPRALLRAIPDLTLVEPAEQEICCGSAGVYNLLQPEAAAELGQRKAANLLATGAEAVAAANPGCLLQIRAHLEEAGRPLEVYHPVELLAASISPAGSSLPRTY